MPRIISLAPSNTEILAALGSLKDLIAVSDYCDFPPEVSQKPKLKGWSTIEKKDVKALSPEFVFLSTICQAELEKDLKKEKFSTFKLDPLTLKEVSKSFLQLGKMVGKNSEAEKLSIWFQNKLEKIEEKIPPNSKRPRIYCEEWSKPPMVSGNWVPELIEKVGGIPFPLSRGDRSREIDLSEVVQFNPEMILLSICSRHSTKVDPNLILKRKGWKLLDAVQNRRIYSINDSLLNRPGPRLVQGAELIQSIVGEVFWGWEPVNSSDLRRLETL